MSNVEPGLPGQGFFGRLKQASESLLLLDYDGTLAPFVEDPSHAVPYPEVLPLLYELAQSVTRVVLVTGRTVDSLRRLLPPELRLEIWGSHGAERYRIDGRHEQLEPTATQAAGLAAAAAWLNAHQMDLRSELKAGALSVHLRALPQPEAERREAALTGPLTDFAQRHGLALGSFSRGLELRIPGWHKGRAVTTVLAEYERPPTVAFLGDDRTDEDAFAALPEDGLAVLVRPQWRETLATVWLRPPHELVAFLARWRHAVAP